MIKNYPNLSDVYIYIYIYIYIVHAYEKYKSF